MPTVTLTPSPVDGVLNGISEVTIVSPPSPGVNRLVRWLSIHNADNMDVELFLYVANGASRRIVFHALLNPGDTFHLDSSDVMPLDSNRSIVAKLGAPPNTINPDWVAGWADQTIA
jgi:hypothetical protein